MFQCFFFLSRQGRSALDVAREAGHMDVLVAIQEKVWSQVLEPDFFQQQV